MKKRNLQMKWTKRIVLIALLLGVAGLGKMYAQNLIVNSDFESGNTGFITDYTYTPSGQVDEGYYCIDVTAQGHSGGQLGWSNISGYGGSGKYMLVNGHGGATNPTKIVWKQTVNVTANTDYIFSCQVVNLAQSFFGYSPNPAILRLKINGSNVGSDWTIAQNNVWHEWSNSWSSGSATQAIIEIYDVYTGNSGLGDDFGLDHFQLTPQATYSVNAFDDFASVCLYNSVQIDVLANDIITPSGQQSGATVQIIQSPQHGTATWTNNTRKIHYMFTDASYSGDLDQLKYRVTIPHGEMAEAWVYVTTSKQPSVGWINPPATICAGDHLGITVPTVEPAQGTGQWEYSPTQNGTYSPIPDPNNVPFSMNSNWVRYSVTNDCGESHSNSVQITVKDVPSIDTIQAPLAINAGGSFNLTQPTIQPNGSPIFNQGWQIAATQNGSYTPFNNNNVPYSYNGYWIRYFADNDCGVGYSNAVQITVYQDDNNIVFADANVKAICVANWDTNGDGELSYDEAAAVTDLGQVFRGNTTITSFEELQYFTGLTDINSYTFYWCRSLSSVVIPNSVTTIARYAFVSCDGLISVVIPNSVTYIGTYAFGYCNLASITIPNSVVYIGEGAFCDCRSLTSIAIPSSVTHMGSNPFVSCSGLEQITVDSGNTVYDSRNNCNAIIRTSTSELLAGCENTIIPDSVISIGINAFYNCTDLTSIVIPNSVVSIGGAAFSHTGLTSIVIPASVTSLENAFWACHDLEQIMVDFGNLVYDSRENCNAIINTSSNELILGCKNTAIPNSVTSIGGWAFEECIGMSSINIPNSVTFIGNYAFHNCLGLSSITVLSETPPTLDYDVFEGVDTTIPVYVPCNSISAYQSAGGWNEFTNYLPATECDSGVITVTVNPTEGGIVTGAGYYEGGVTCTLTATPNDGFSFLNWTENGVIVSNDTVYSFIVSGDRDLVANFAEEGDVCTLTFDLFDSYGDGYTGNYLVVTDENGFSQQLTVESGSSAVYTLPFLTGSHITLTWIVGSYPEDCSFTVSYSNGNVICHGENLNENFYYEFDVDCVGMPVSTFDVTAVANPIDGGTITGTGQYEYNATCTLTAIANEGYAFVNWTQGGTIVSNDVEYSFYVVDNVAVVANFIPLGNIDFVDANVKAICVANWDTNGDGELSYAEAAAVTNLGQVFRENMEITSFEELQYFTGLTTISDYAFYNCSNLSGSLYIPNSVTWIKVSAFYGCNGFIGNLTIPNSVIIIGDWAFDGCSGFTGTLSIPSSVTIIGHGAFDGCSGFTGSLTIPNSVTMIGFRAFYNCSGFTGGLTIPNSVTTIGSVAFGECRGFSGSLIIPNSVIEIDYNPFAGCTGIEQIMVEINNPRYDSRENCNAIIETNTFKLVSGCKNSVILNGVTSIGGNAFCGCSGLTGSLIIPNSVTSIDGGAFQDCSGLTGNLTIPNSVTTIGNLAFHGCEGFTGSLTIPNSVTTIGIDAFSGCSGLTGNLNIPNSVTSIGDNAFRNCSGFTGSLTIGNSVTSIGGYAFGNCSGFTEAIMYNSTVPSLGSNAFSFMPFPIFVPYESLNDYKTATNWNDHEYRIFPMAYTMIPGYGEGEGNYRFIASPLVENTAPTAVDNMITETAYDLYRFDQSEDAEWQNYKYPENTANFFLVNGQGYLYANSEEVNLIFKGAFNEDDTKEVGLAYDATATFAGWNLVGNPFPVNAYANKSYYTMNEEGTAIEPVAVSMETAIPACTGVMVMAEAEGETVVFSTDTPEAATNQGCLQIELSQAVELVETPTRKQDGPSTGSVTLHDKAIVSFNAGDRLEKFVFNKENAVISISQGGKELAIACSDKQGEMPLNFKASKNGEYTLTINPEAVELEYLHLIDNLTGADVDLLALRQAQGPANYTFEAKTTDYASRFRLVFSGKEADGPSSGSETFAFINNGNIIITGADAGATLQIVDMTGRVVVSCGGHMRCVPTTGMAKGLYVLRLINGDDVKTQKIVIR